MANPVGRPPVANPRTITVGFKVTTDEYEALRKLARTKRHSVGQTVRDVALASLTVKAKEAKAKPTPKPKPVPVMVEHF